MKIHLIGFLEFLGLYLPLCLVALLTVCRQFTDPPRARKSGILRQKNEGKKM